MNNGKIFNILNTIIRKEKEGQTISPEQFNELLEICSWEKANADFSYFEASQIITDSLLPLKTEDNMTITAGVGDLSLITDYWHATNAYHSITGYDVVPIDICEDVVYHYRAYSDLEAPTDYWPILKEEGTEIKVLPATITSITLLYLKQPATPFYDYYTNADDKLIYILPDTEYSIVAGETYIDKDDGTEHSGPYTITAGENKSTELSFPEGERVQVLYLILQKLGIPLNKVDAVQYGMTREQKEEAQ